MLTQERLKKILHYDDKTGLFTWKQKQSTKISVGDNAGTIGSGGYILIKIDGKRHLAHRLAWLYVYGKNPGKCLDHINRNPLDNFISNLREVTTSENMHNCNLHKNNKSGHCGVYWNERIKRWNAQLKKNYKTIHIGSYKTFEDAVIARKQAEQIHFPGVRI